MNWIEVKQQIMNLSKYFVELNEDTIVIPAVGTTDEALVYIQNDNDTIYVRTYAEADVKRLPWYSISDEYNYDSIDALLDSISFAVKVAEELTEYYKSGNYEKDVDTLKSLGYAFMDDPDDGIMGLYVDAMDDESSFVRVYIPYQETDFIVPAKTFKADLFVTDENFYNLTDPDNFVEGKAGTSLNEIMDVVKRA